MKQKYLKVLLALCLLSGEKVSAQLPAAWPGVVSQLSAIMDTADARIDSSWNGQYNYCTSFAGDLLLANSNRGYNLFTQNPPGGLDTNYQNILLSQVDTMLMMMDSVGYTSVDITLSYPLLLDSFPNSSIYLAFYKKVYAMARSMGFRIIENCQVSLAADSGAAEPYLINDIRNFYFAPHGVPDTINTARYLSTMTQMMQTIIDSLTPDYLTLEMEPQTQQYNTFNVLNFTPDTTLMYVNYFTSHLLHKGNILYGAGAGSWNQLAYFQNYATTDVDYIDYHLYPINGGCLNNTVFGIDSIAQAAGKKIVVGECWLHKNSDSEYVYVNPAYLDELDGERDVFNYFEGLDTQFTQMMINLSQQANIEMVNFFNTPSEFGYLTYGPPYDSLSLTTNTTLGTKAEYDNMFNMQLGPCGVFTRNAIAKINCTDTTVNTGVRNTSAGPALYIYPNPANRLLDINCAVALQVIDVCDVFGQNLMQLSPDGTAAHQQIDISALSPGVYFIKVQTPAGYSIRKFIKED